MAEVTNEAAAEKAQKVLCCWTVGDQRDGGFGQFRHQVIRIDVVGTKDSVSVTHMFQDGQPGLFSVLQLSKELATSFPSSTVTWRRTRRPATDELTVTVTWRDQNVTHIHLDEASRPSYDTNPIVACWELGCTIGISSFIGRKHQRADSRSVQDKLWSILSTVLSVQYSDPSGAARTKIETTYYNKERKERQRQK